MKKIKWTIFLISAALMFITAHFAVFSAAEITTEGSHAVSIDYNAEVSYKVTIPASVIFSKEETTAERALQASDVVLNEGEHLNIYVESMNGFKMVNESGFIEYDMKVNGQKMSGQESIKILSVAAGEKSGWAVLNFSTNLSNENIRFAGNYSDTLTFTVSVT